MVAHALLDADVDAVVIDDPEDLTMQVKLDDGAWHTKMVGGFRTRCDQPIHYRLVLDTRVETYSTEKGPLCTGGCFSAAELEESARLNLARKDD